MKTRPGHRYDEATHQWLPVDAQPAPAKPAPKPEPTPAPTEKD